MTEKTKEQVKSIIKELFEKACFYCDNLEIEKIEEFDKEDMFIIKIISSGDYSLLLGNKGDNLKAIEHIARILVAKKLNQKINFIIDVNNFRKERNEKIIELTRLVAKKVQSMQKAQVLAPMSAYERRLVHLELATWPDITTESIGEEPRRRVVIRPYP